MHYSKVAKDYREFDNGRSTYNNPFVKTNLNIYYVKNCIDTFNGTLKIFIRDPTLTQ
jgi:hypothetical protein